MAAKRLASFQQPIHGRMTKKDKYYMSEVKVYNLSRTHRMFLKKLIVLLKCLLMYYEKLLCRWISSKPCEHFQNVNHLSSQTDSSSSLPSVMATPLFIQSCTPFSPLTVHIKTEKIALILLVMCLLNTSSIFTTPH